jgi:hypothetical protein
MRLMSPKRVPLLLKKVIRVIIGDRYPLQPYIFLLLLSLLLLLLLQSALVHASLHPPKTKLVKKIYTMQKTNRFSGSSEPSSFVHGLLPQ